MTHDSPKDERYLNGAKMRRRVLGDAWVDNSEKNRNSFNSDWVDFITRGAWNDVWTRPGLEPKIRSVITLSVVLALGHWDEFRLHIRGAVNNGWTRDEIKEMIIHAAVYAGVPASNHAMKEAEGIFKDMNM
jgi:4-carboxymuconolactone decarboxylase